MANIILKASFKFLRQLLSYAYNRGHFENGTKYQRYFKLFGLRILLDLESSLFLDSPSRIFISINNQ
jgi:hypothetical protein